ncbi:MAG TPA: multifunctional CCA tRNA nucleotidyl transferase/2'3'-cyclic phosphodiesterase/2'nucleotidase/phosphatase [Casimicrobiaceae bacterium]
MARRARPQPVRTYRVGGSVRDELLGRTAGDRDYVVVGATPEIMLASGFTPVGRDFPVFLHPETHEEYALARTERKAGRGYRGFEFFATPEVTLEDDLRRRDLTINAMARDENGRLIDPWGGEADLNRKLLRHVSPAFAEDPLRVLRVARFAARLGFRVAPSTMRLMREIVDGGELETLAHERVWQELARGLGEAHPSRMLAVLERCGALAVLLPELARDDAARRAAARALDRAARRSLPLAARYAILVYPFESAARAAPVGTRARVAEVEAISARLRVPANCRDVARLVARWQHVLADPAAAAPATLLELLHAVDALRRPARLDLVVRASREITAAAGRDRGNRAAVAIEEALAAVRAVDAAAIARDAAARAIDASGAGSAGGTRSAAIAAALRRARLAALRAWRRRYTR